MAYKTYGTYETYKGSYMSDLTRAMIEGWLSVEEPEFNIETFRRKHGVDPESSVLYVTFNRLMGEKKLKRLGRGLYRQIKPVKRVTVFDKSRERRQPFNLIFPRDFDTGMEMDFSEHIVIREGDLIEIGGQSNWGKTTLALNFAGENIDRLPVLMGNEYTTRVGDTDEYEPTARFLNRLDNMDWIQWTNGDGSDKFELLPVRADYAEHIVKNRINIIDWINLPANQLYDISRVEEDIKAELGRGIGIPVLQKGIGDMARGGQFTKDFIDCELLIDKFTENESMLTIGKVKECTRPVMGKTYAFGIFQGVKITNFREIVKCNTCYGKGWKKAGNTSIPCEDCRRTGYVDL